MANGALTFLTGPLRGEVLVPGDKSISHRALIVAARSAQPARITNLNGGRDVLATQLALQSLGARVERVGDSATVHAGALHDPADAVDCMNSGSSARMLLGVCAGANLRARFDGDASLRRRPMEPVAAQLRAYGARIETTKGTLPATIQGTRSPQTRRFILLAPSAQVKSALLFAGLFGGVPVRTTSDKGSRDHTERLLRYHGADISFDRSTVTLRGAPSAYRDVEVPGDFSAAAFFIVAATVARGSRVRIRDVGVNPTRTGLLEALRQMGARIELENQRERCGEPLADIVAEHAPLRATAIGADVALRCIDEIPVLAVAAAFAEGETKISGVRDLRTKESDRIAAIHRLLATVGVRVEDSPTGISIFGGSQRMATQVIETQGDHRTAMAAAALAAGTGELRIDSAQSLAVSFPGFAETLRRLQNA